MLLNPDFVLAHCQRDEHLVLLVLHELWHVLLAHTRMYERATTVDNIAFDAIINAGLARSFPGPQWRGFLEAVNPAGARFQETRLVTTLQACRSLPAEQVLAGILESVERFAEGVLQQLAAVEDGLQRQLQVAEEIAGAHGQGMVGGVSEAQRLQDVDHARAARDQSGRVHAAAMDGRAAHLVGRRRPRGTRAPCGHAHVGMMLRFRLALPHTAIGALIAGCASYPWNSKSSYA